MVNWSLEKSWEMIGKKLGEVCGLWWRHINLKIHGVYKPNWNVPYIVLHGNFHWKVVNTPKSACWIVGWYHPILTGAERREWMGMGVAGIIINIYCGSFPHSLRLAPVETWNNHGNWGLQHRHQEPTLWHHGVWNLASKCWTMWEPLPWTFCGV